MNTKQLLEVSLLTRLNLLLTNALVSVQTLTNEVATVEGANPVTQALVETNLSDLFKVLLPLEMEPFNRYSESIVDYDGDYSVKFNHSRGYDFPYVDLDVLSTKENVSFIFVDSMSAKRLTNILAKPRGCKSTGVTIAVVRFDDKNPEQLFFMNNVVENLSNLGSHDGFVGLKDVRYYCGKVYVVVVEGEYTHNNLIGKNPVYAFQTTVIPERMYPGTSEVANVRFGKVIEKGTTHISEATIDSGGENLLASMEGSRGLIDYIRKPSLTERLINHDARVALLLNTDKEELPKNPEIPFGGLFVKFDFDKFNAETDQKAKFQLLTDFYKSEIAAVTDNVSGEFGEYEHGLYEKTTYRYFVELMANQFIELRAVDLEFDPSNLFAKEPSVPEEVVKSLEVSSDRLGETWIYNRSQVGMFSTMSDAMVDFALKLYKQQGRPDLAISDAPNVHTLLYVSVADDCV